MREILECVGSKFLDPDVTAKGEMRASVDLKQLKTLWFNTGTLCNITCRNCYIESSPKNDRLVYIAEDEVIRFLDEIRDLSLGTEEIGLTGGEPFMNPDILRILEACLQRGFRVLLLTNAMRPMLRLRQQLLEVREKFGDRLFVRVSLDHYSKSRHEEERGEGTFKTTLEGLSWLSINGFNLSVAGRTIWGESVEAERLGYAEFFARNKIMVDASDPQALVLFPEMDETAVVPEITTACWDVLGISPDDLMCASSRMVVKRKGDAAPVVMACTLLAYDNQFNLGQSLLHARKRVALNHPHCAKFCVLGGGTCSVA